MSEDEDRTPPPPPGTLWLLAHPILASILLGLFWGIGWGGLLSIVDNTFPDGRTLILGVAFGLFGFGPLVTYLTWRKYQGE